MVEQKKSKTLKIRLKKYERRFGFSLMGGLEQGFSANVEAITPGSPADRANLEVGDEIVEINGYSLSNCTHAQIISYIHQCIKSRTIQLRVKRNEPDQVPELTEIQDAYVIAVEDQARQRLERLSDSHKITPVDMTKLFSSTSEHTETPLPVLSELLHNGTVPVESLHQSNKEDMSNVMELNRVNGYVDSHKGKTNAKISNDTHVIAPVDMQYENPVYYDKRTNSYDGLDQNLEVGHIELNDSGPHREMAIDVPSGFVGSVKEPPRFPKQPQTTPRSSTKRENPPPYSEAERLKKYQEDLRKRKEEERKQFEEQEFLRTSLRSSKKLQELEHNKPKEPPSGFENPTYLEEEDLNRPGAGKESVSRAATLPIRQPVTQDRYLTKTLDVDDLFSSLQYIQAALQSEQDQKDVAVLSQLFQNQKFQEALVVHNQVLDVSSRSPQPSPLCNNAQDTLVEALNSLKLEAPPTNPDVHELARLLLTPNMQGVLFAHDRIAERQTLPPDDEEDNQEDLVGRLSKYDVEDSVKIVRIHKTADPLGATVRNEGESVIIGRIVKGGIAEKSGLLHEGDEILEVNGTDVRGKNVNDVCDLMASMSGTLTFLVIPVSQDFHTLPKEEQVIHIRASYDYEPEDDLYIPCRELGISFQKGDILHVINQDDVNWWQAYREGEEDMALAGLIPSKTFQEQRESMKQTIVGNEDNKENIKKGRRCVCGKKKRKQKQKLYNAQNEEFDREEILTYEEVALYYPQPNRKRPIVLIGPPNVGRQELRQRLMESDPERFAAAVPHTSRPRKEDEDDGKDYHFIPRHVLEAEIRAHQFVEFGEYQKNLYGTSLGAIRQVINSGKICVLNLHPQSLRILKSSDLKPYVVFIAPPNMEKLKQILQNLGKRLQDDELKEIVDKGREMEDNYGHYFDMVIVNQNMERAYDELLTEINRLEVEPQWVPSSWINT